MTGFFLDWWTPIKYMPQMLQAAGITIMFTIIVFIIEVFLGAFLGYIRYHKKGILYPIVTIYVEIIRNTPLLVQLYVIFYGLPSVGIKLTPYQTGFLALIMYGCAYGCEIYRGGIQSIDNGQWEAGACVGLSRRQIFMDIIFPQTLRNIFPALTNECIGMLYATSLLSVLNIREIMSQTKFVAGSTFRTLEMYITSLILYYVLASLLAFILRKINMKYFPSISSRGE